MESDFFAEQNYQNFEQMGPGINKMLEMATFNPDILAS